MGHLIPWTYFQFHLPSCVLGSSATGSINGSGNCQNHSASLNQATGPTPPATHTQKGKGTFTDDLHQLVDNWARDAINLSQCKRGPKTGTQAAVGHDVSIQYFGCMTMYHWFLRKLIKQVSVFKRNYEILRNVKLYVDREGSRQYFGATSWVCTFFTVRHHTNKIISIYLGVYRFRAYKVLCLYHKYTYIL